MRISELIAELERIKASRGDLKVYGHDGGGPEYQGADWWAAAELTVGKVTTPVGNIIDACGVKVAT